VAEDDILLGAILFIYCLNQLFLVIYLLLKEIMKFVVTAWIIMTETNEINYGNRGALSRII
jgi:hypothetical protein